MTRQRRPAARPGEAPGRGPIRRRRPATLLWGALAASLALGALAFAFRRLELEHLRAVLEAADWKWLAVVAISVPAEQWLRGWKWRQILHDIRAIATARLFCAVMAGYFANLMVPVGIRRAILPRDNSLIPNEYIRA